MTPRPHALAGWLPLAALVTLLSGLPADVAAQVLRGQVVDAADQSRVIPEALVKLYDGDDEEVAVSLSDAEGWYTLEIPAPGTWTIRAEALGWRPYESTAFETTGQPGTFRVNLLMDAAPVSVRGLEIGVERVQRVARAVQGSIGVDPGSLRNPAIGKIRIDGHARAGRSLITMLRYEDLTGVQIEDQLTAVCFRFRGYCLPLYFDEVRVDATAFAPGMPLELLEMVVVVTPGESAAYRQGGVFVYSTSWVR